MKETFFYTYLSFTAQVMMMMMIIMMIILVQGGGLRPRSSSGQWVGAVWWLYTFFAIATYTANMGAFLTISRMVKDIDSFEYLQKQNRMK